MWEILIEATIVGAAALVITAGLTEELAISLSRKARRFRR